MEYKLGGLLSKGIGRNFIIILKVKGENSRVREMLVTKIAFLPSETFLVILLLLQK